MVRKILVGMLLVGMAAGADFATIEPLTTCEVAELKAAKDKLDAVQEKIKKAHGQKPAYIPGEIIYGGCTYTYKTYDIVKDAYVVVQETQLNACSSTFVIR